MNKALINLQTRLMARRNRAVSMLEYVLIASVIIGLAVVVTRFFGGAITDLVDRMTGQTDQIVTDGGF